MPSLRLDRGQAEKIAAYLTTLRKGMDDLRKVAQVAAEVKKLAKASQGNSLFVDRRTE